jgi:hypothetical protein
VRRAVHGSVRMGRVAGGTLRPGMVRRSTRRLSAPR